MNNRLNPSLWTKKWFKLFTIAAFAAALAVLAIWFGLLLASAARQRAAAEAIRALDGVVVYDYFCDLYQRALKNGRSSAEFKKIADRIDRREQSDLESSFMAMLRRIAGPDLFHDVARVNLAYFYDEKGEHHDNTFFLGGAAARFKAFPRLRELLLQGSGATDAVLE